MQDVVQVAIRQRLLHVGVVIVWNGVVSVEDCRGQECRGWCQWGGLHSARACTLVAKPVQLSRAAFPRLGETAQLASCGCHVLAAPRMRTESVLSEKLLDTCKFVVGICHQAGLACVANLALPYGPIQYQPHNIIVPLTAYLYPLSLQDLEAAPQPSLLCILNHVRKVTVSG